MDKYTTQGLIDALHRTYGGQTFFVKDAQFDFADCVANVTMTIQADYRYIRSDGITPPDYELMRYDVDTHEVSLHYENKIKYLTSDELYEIDKGLQSLLK